MVLVPTDDLLPNLPKTNLLPALTNNTSPARTAPYRVALGHGHAACSLFWDPCKTDCKSLTDNDDELPQPQETTKSPCADIPVVDYARTCRLLNKAWCRITQKCKSYEVFDFLPDSRKYCGRCCVNKTLVENGPQNIMVTSEPSEPYFTTDLPCMKRLSGEG